MRLGSKNIFESSSKGFPKNCVNKEIKGAINYDEKIRHIHEINDGLFQLFIKGEFQEIDQKCRKVAENKEENDENQADSIRVI